MTAIEVDQDNLIHLLSQPEPGRRYRLWSTSDQPVITVESVSGCATNGQTYVRGRWEGSDQEVEWVTGEGMGWELLPEPEPTYEPGHYYLEADQTTGWIRTSSETYPWLLLTYQSDSGRPGGLNLVNRVGSSFGDSIPQRPLTEVPW